MCRAVAARVKDAVLCLEAVSGVMVSAPGLGSSEGCVPLKSGAGFTGCARW